jgi:hypothetical protein
MFKINWERRECFPDSVDRMHLLNITSIEDSWSVFLTPDGKVHRCEVYYKQYLAEIENGTSTGTRDI